MSDLNTDFNANVISIYPVGGVLILSPELQRLLDFGTQFKKFGCCVLHHPKNTGEYVYAQIFKKGKKC